MQSCSSALRQFKGTSCISKAFTNVRVQHANLQVTSAVSRRKKEEVVSTLKHKLDESVIVFGMRFRGLDVPTIQKFRKGLPPNCSVYVSKNTLMKVAISQTQGWDVLADIGCKGENAWVFVNEGEVADAVKHYFKFEEDAFIEAKKQAAKNQDVKPPTEISCAVMSGKYLNPAELKKCENLPTKPQLYATIARLAKQPAQKLAIGIKSVPSNLAVALSMVANVDDDKTGTLALVVKA